MNAVRLEPDQLKRSCDPASLPFETTAEVEPLAEPVGQPRALRAVEFGLAIEAPGYNVFATGPVGTGKRSTLLRLLREKAAGRKAPGDWVYLFDFAAPDTPRAVLLAAGRGEELVREMSHFVEEARARIADAFRSEQYGERRRALGEELEKRGEEALGPLRELAAERGLAVELTPAGVAIIPMTHGHPLAPEQFQHLPEAQRQEIVSHTEEVQARLPATISRLAEIQRDARRQIEELDREVAEFAIGHLVEELETRFAEPAGLRSWLESLTDDVVDNLGRFRAEDGEQQLPEPIAASARRSDEQFFARYRPTLLVSHPDGDGAPVVFETNPTHYNLFGRIDYEASFGAVTTDHRRIRPGAVHRANGGYLVLDAARVLTQPLVWEKLKETLRAGRIAIENFGAQLTMFPTATLEPEPIELDLKVVLVGTAELYALLYRLDEDLRKLFKVRADFDLEMPWEAEQDGQYAAFVAGQVREHGLLEFDRRAVARVIEQGARLRESQERLSARFQEIAELVAEASHWAAAAGRGTVGVADVERAVEERVHRSNLVEEKVREEIRAGTLVVDLGGERVGQVNGLSVAALGDHEFGRPARITAAVAVGSGEMLNIDRETELSGPIHDKGFLILSGFLRERYGGEQPLSLAASLVFEQSYGMVEGDSASAAELFALLSSLAELPLRQGVAVTGSVDQHGRIQAIGGVNAKVEGFFAVCREAGLDGEQGVMIPAANRRHLMLREEVVAAVREGAFNVWAISDADQGIELLSGRPAGRLLADGAYEEGSVHRLVADRLTAFAAARREFGRDEGGAKG
ncbi:MAG: AAA family ATPase [Solirubrobacterales bacterium]